MITPHTPESLKAFNQRVADAFNAGQIRAPIHLDGGNESSLIAAFQDIADEDWIACSWRSYSKCLLKGVPEEELFQDIVAGKGISLCYPSHRVISSGIVGGILPIALGIAWSIKRRGGTERVHVFSGDMTVKTGIYAECFDYAVGFALPMTFVTEDNKKSVCTPTHSVWGEEPDAVAVETKYISYDLPWPHSGAGKRIQF